MGFKLKSGNSTSFKGMGSSPVKNRGARHSKPGHPKGGGNVDLVGKVGLLAAPQYFGAEEVQGNTNPRLTDAQRNELMIESGMNYKTKVDKEKEIELGIAPGESQQKSEETKSVEITDEDVEKIHKKNEKKTSSSKSSSSSSKTSKSSKSKSSKSSNTTLDGLISARSRHQQGSRSYNKITTMINQQYSTSKGVLSPKQKKQMRKMNNKVYWGQGQRDWLGRKRDKTKRNKQTWWNPWD